ncbi:hypothetical protein BCR43DRAFT_513744 [Syncephalastrum racemosum]|uniref:Uncharacterized protein n=1 Tax=Syncephalastrum racemosum TaxID=13706 RepID=A0A1X2HEH1_SYNRA|nr:hypothetical protein BCR43DRAFT_513744 [Syncephalastrum racemosum]
MIYKKPSLLSHRSLRWSTASEAPAHALTASVCRRLSRRRRRTYPLSRNSKRKPNPSSSKRSTSNNNNNNSNNRSSGGGSSSNSNSMNTNTKLAKDRRWTIATISSTSISPPATAIYRCDSDPGGRPNIFSRQSLLFLFGFLFFPCWWIGAFWVHSTPPKDVRQSSAMAVHPSLLANGRVASRLFLLLPDEEEHVIPADWYTEQQMFRRWNRYMSFASVPLLAVILSMLSWYYVGIQRKWWHALPFM